MKKTSIGCAFFVVSTVSSFTLPNNGGLVTSQRRVERLGPSFLGRRDVLLLEETATTEETVATEEPVQEQELQEKPLVELSGFDEARIVLGLMDDPNLPEGAEPPSAIDRIKKAGLAGTIAYASWELLFWTVSIPAAVVAYHSSTGEWPDLSTDEGKLKVFELSTAFLTVARVIVPLRIGLALATAPWIAKNVLPLFDKENEA